MRMKRAGHQPMTIGMSIYGGIFCKLYEVPDPGTLIPQHAHEYDHLTLLMRGSVRVWREESPPADYTAPAMIHIAARAKHQFLTLGYATVLACLHAADRLDDEGEPVIVEENQIEMEG